MSDSDNRREPPDDQQPWVPYHHDASCKGEDTYIDPVTGRIVFTEAFLLRRGFCCGSGCRHCPYQPGGSGTNKEDGE